MKKKLFSLILGIFVLLILLIFVDFKELVSLISGINIEYVLTAILLTFISVIIRSYRWFVILKNRGAPVKYIDAFKIFSASNFIFLFMPNVAGDFYRGYSLKKLREYKFVKGLSSAIFEKFINFGMIILFGSLWLVMFILTKGINIELEFIILLSFVLLFIVGAFFVMRNPKIVFKFFSNLSERIKFLGFLDLKKYGKKYGKSFLREFKELSKDKKILRCTLILTAFAWLIMGFRFYILALSLGINVSFVSILGIYFLAAGIGALSMAPGSLGSKEAIIVLLLLIVGVSKNSGITLALLDRSIFIIMCVFYALIFYHINKKINFSKEKMKINNLLNKN